MTREVTYIMRNFFSKVIVLYAKSAFVKVMFVILM